MQTVEAEEFTTTLRYTDIHRKRARLLPEHVQGFRRALGKHAGQTQ